MTGAEELGGKLLEGVSRSFYLTLKALPQGLREPLSLAYLLARAADTLADTATVRDEVRLDSLREFDRILQSGVRDAPAERVLAEALRQDFVPLQEDAHEARLLERLQEVLDAFHLAPERQQEAMRGVLAPIIRGQILDIQRFPGDGAVRALATAADLDEYTWLVAGCVGEFWTRLCVQEAEGSFSPGVSLEELITWGTRFGKGLQLVNILRDLGKDLRLGRCYLPAEELAARGGAVEEVVREPARLIDFIGPWRSLCRQHLEEGLRYLDAIQNRRLLYATSLPLLLGIRTLALIDQADWPALAQGIKVSRGETARILFDAGVAVLRKGGIRRLGEKLFAAEESSGPVGP